jgi:uncharacterized protein YjbJ (UPF0337 family)
MDEFRKKSIDQQVGGKGEKLKGKFKEGVGKISGDQDLEAEGQVDQGEGAVREKMGKAGRSISVGGRVLDPHPGHHDAFRLEQRPFQTQVVAVPAQPPAGRDDAVAWHVRTLAGAHDVAHGAGGARPPGQGRHLAVAGDASWRDPPDHAEHAGRERGDDCRLGHGAAYRPFTEASSLRAWSAPAKSAWSLSASSKVCLAFAR